MTVGTLRDPEMALVLANVPRASRAAFELLFLLDERLGAIVREPNQPIVAIKLAWWREALEQLDTAPPPPEPLLRAICEQLLPAGVSGADLAAIAAGWDALIDGETDEAASVERHASLRGGGLFAAGATLLGGARETDVRAAGGYWALATLDGSERATACRLAIERTAVVAALRWPRALRALGVLVVLARDGLAHQESGKGSPRRVARALWHAISGR